MNNINFGWIYYNPEIDREMSKILEEMNSGMADYLGLGSIRDAIRKELFPGVVRPMTRLKYYFTTAYIARYLYDNGPKIRNADSKIKEIEAEIRKSFISQKMKMKEEKSEKITGIIGIEQKARMATPIYFPHLTDFGFIEQSRGLSYDDIVNMNRKKQEDTETENAEMDSTYIKFKFSGIEKDYKNFKNFASRKSKKLDINLSRTEKTFIKNKIFALEGAEVFKACLKRDLIKAGLRPALGKIGRLKHTNNKTRLFIRAVAKFNDIANAAHLILFNPGGFKLNDLKKVSSKDVEFFIKIFENMFAKQSAIKAEQKRFLRSLIRLRERQKLINFVKNRTRSIKMLRGKKETEKPYSQKDDFKYFFNFDIASRFIGEILGVKNV